MTRGESDRKRIRGAIPLHGRSLHHRSLHNGGDAHARRSILRSQAARFRPLATAWLLAVGVDLFFNAGVFVNLFDQDREPALLSDAELFRRVPVAYVALAIGVAALGWLVDRLDTRGAWSGAGLGATAGLLVAILGIINVWTALDVTLALVAAGTVVQVAQFSAAGAFLATYRDSEQPARLVWRTVLAALSLAAAAIVLQNVIGA